jgi:hypothetical protein
MFANADSWPANGVSGVDSKILCRAGGRGGARVLYPSVLLALASMHDGFFKGVSHYAQEQQWRLVTGLIYTGKIPLGWRAPASSRLSVTALT